MQQIRFNKGNIQLDYPLTQRQVDMLPIGTNLHSPIAVTHDWVKIKPTELSVRPIYPFDEGFEDQLMYVIKNVIKSRKRQVFKRDEISGTVRERYKVTNYHELGKLVEADMPPDIVIELADYLLDNGCKFRNITNEGNYTNFTNGVVLLCRILAWSTHYVSPTCFSHKYFYGVPRPEEVVQMLVKGEITFSDKFMSEFDRIINDDWKKEIENNAANFTIYNNGAPLHPSFPAMHSAAAAATLLLPVFLDVNKLELHEIRKTMLDISFGRTMAGVHYPQDNYYGLEVGERVIEKILPYKLAKFGANRNEVTQLIKKYRTDWLSFI